MIRVFVLIFILAGILTALAHGEVVDKIAVIVNCEVITQREVERLMEPIGRQYRTLYNKDELPGKLEEARENIINQLIEDRLILGEAKRLNIEVSEQDLDARIEETRRRFESNEQFEKALLEQGLNVRDLKTRFKEQLMTRRLIDQKVGSRIMITPVEISDYYNQHKEEFASAEEVKVRMILIRPKSEGNAREALIQAKEILRRVREGGDFAGLAKEYSEGPYAAEGGLMGDVKRGDLLPQLEDVVFSMDEGEVSEIVQTALGYHILKVEEKAPPQTRGLTDVRHEVEEAIFRIKMKDKVGEWVQGLRKNAYIAFK